MTKIRPLLVWLEDREKSVDYFHLHAIDGGCEVEMFASPQELVEYLEEEFGSPPDPARLSRVKLGFVIDLMLLGVTDLRGIGIAETSTTGGVFAGYVFVDRYLKDPSRRYSQHPVCFLTERELTTELRSKLSFLHEAGGLRIFAINKKRDLDRAIFTEFLQAVVE